jgi:hypothetical protein
MNENFTANKNQRRPGAQGAQAGLRLGYYLLSL